MLHAEKSTGIEPIPLLYKKCDEYSGYGGGSTDFDEF
jgi:hypothetical protein